MRRIEKHLKIYTQIFGKLNYACDIKEKYFRYTNKINPEHMNIAYTNVRCKSVSDEVRKQLGKINTYEINEEMICRLYLRYDGAKFNATIR